MVGCESNFNPEALNVNKTGSKDIGLGQINSIHWKSFLKKGLDVVNDPIDNLIATIQFVKENPFRYYKASYSCWKDWKDEYKPYYPSLAYAP